MGATQHAQGCCVRKPIGHRRPITWQRPFLLEALRVVLTAWAIAAAFTGHPQNAWAQQPQTTPALPPDTFSQTVADVRTSIVAIGSYYFKDEPTVQYVGTGFVINDGLSAVTNAHVVDALKKNDRLTQMRVFFPDDRPVDGRRAEVWAYDKLHDIAILRFESPRAKTMTLQTAHEPAQGLAVGILGYPIGLKLGLVPAAHRGVVAAVVPAVLPLPKGARLTPELAEAIREPYNLYQLDLVVFPGNSGSPLFDVRDGSVYGIINKTLATRTREHLLSAPSGIAYAVPAYWIKHLSVRVASMTEDDRQKELKRLGLVGD